MNGRGLFIVVEGIDGSGKTTQIEKLKRHLQVLGNDVLVTREPGGTRIGEKIREILLDPANLEMEGITEMLLYAASRAQHVRELIEKNLECGVSVISDRYVLSSYVYQGVARGIDMEIVKAVNHIAMKNVIPDILFFIDIDNEESLKRRAKRKCIDRMENEEKAFHYKVCDGYRALIGGMDHIVRVNGMQAIEDVARDMIFIVDEKLKNLR